MVGWWQMTAANHEHAVKFPAEIRKRNPFNKPRDLPMGEIASALEF
jgi:hypothetical protein